MKIACGIEYFSDQYYGFQRQISFISIQEVLERAISNIADQPIEIFCAGRTDTGVHAIGQVIHFETSTHRSMDTWVKGVNAKLPADIRLQWAREVPDDFHARYSATARRYEYWIDNTKIPSVIWQKHMLHHFFYLDAEKMNQAVQVLLGEYDFSAFRSSECQSPTPRRSVYFAQVSRHGDFLKLELEANAFLHHMIRNIVGSLLPIGDGREPASWLKFLLDQKDRTLSGMTVKPHGLYLVSVTYPEHFEIPMTANCLQFSKSVDTIPARS